MEKETKKTLKKAELLANTRTIAQENGVTLSKQDVDVVVKALYEAITQAVKDGYTCKINEITYSIKEVPERRGVIQLGDKAGQEWVKPAHKEVAVKVSKVLKELLA